MSKILNILRFPARVGVKPGKSACPLRLDINTYLRLAGEEKKAEALHLMKEVNPFPSVCGLCGRDCESVRPGKGSPVSHEIARLKEETAAYQLCSEETFLPNCSGGRVEKIAVIGGGTAGCACAYALARAGFERVTVFERNEYPGGLLSYAPASMGVDAEVVSAETAALEEMGIEFVCSTEIGGDKGFSKLRELGFEAICIATGAQENVDVGIRGEELPGVIGGIELLRDAAANMSIELGQRCAVIGGGAFALVCALKASELGAEQISLIYNRRREDMRLPEELLRSAEEEGILLEFLKTPAELTGCDGRVEGMWLDSVELREMAELTRELVPVGKREFEHRSFDSVIIAVGRKPNVIGLDKHHELIYNLDGTVVADPATGRTDAEGVFICGEALRPCSAVEALASGIRTAAAIAEYLN